MVLFNYSTKELTAKIVYYGPGLCGKTTNLQYIFDNLPSNIHKGKMLSLATKTDRTLFFDFLPIDLGTIRGMRTRLQLYTVPGQVFYNTTRKLVLKGADGLIFVADSQRKVLDANIESFNNLEQNLLEHGLKLSEMPHILQFNKRDLNDIASVEELNAALNRYNSPIYEAVATTGIGVQDTLKAVIRLVLNSLREKYADTRRVEREVAVTVPAAAAAPSPVPTPPLAPAPAAAVLEVEEPPTPQETPLFQVEPLPSVEEEPVLEVEEAPVAEEVAAEAEEPSLAASAEEPVLSIEEPMPEAAASIEALEVEEASPLAAEPLEEEAETVIEEAPAIEVLTESAEAAPLEAAAEAGEEAQLPVEAEEEVPSAEEPPLEEPPLEPLAVSSPEPFEIEVASVEPPASPFAAAPESFTLRMETPPTSASVSVETRAVALGAAGTASVEPVASRESTFPIVVDLQGRTLHLLVTVTVRVEKG